MEYRQQDYKKCTVYVLDFFVQDGIWYFNGYDPDKKSWAVFRADCIISCKSHRAAPQSIFPDKNAAEGILPNTRQSIRVSPSVVF
ncbi:MAG: WYL domain-containing protein [Chordicoccus sp.]